MRTSVELAEHQEESSRVLWLMISCVAFIALLPIQGAISRLTDVLEVLVIVSAVWVCATSRRALAVAAVLGFPAAVLAWIATPGQLAAFNLASAFFGSALWIYVITLMILRIARTRVVTLQTIYLAVSSYILLGFIWAQAYLVVEVLSEGAFHIPSGSSDPVWVSLYYYSFVTLSTLGYGDITPVIGAARSLAILEAISGQLFLALLIASVVGRLGEKAD